MLALGSFLKGRRCFLIKCLKAWRPFTRSSTETHQPVPTAPIFWTKIAAEKVANLQGTRSHHVFALSEPIYKGKYPNKGP